MSLLRLRAKTRRFLRRDSAATDPILVIAAIAVSLVLLIGGSFAVGGMISNAKNLNAQADLDKVATSEVAANSGGGTYMNWNITTAGVIAGDTDTSGNKLNTQAVGFTPTAGDEIKVVANGTGWIAGSLSPTGAQYFRSSTSSTTYVGAAAATAAGAVPAGLTIPTLP